MSIAVHQRLDCVGEIGSDDVAGLTARFVEVASIVRQASANAEGGLPLRQWSRDRPSTLRRHAFVLLARFEESA
jgi:hypothetical protein